MFSHTIAIARCLLLDGRTLEVEEMITPIIRDVSRKNPPDYDPGKITLLRCLLAQAYLLGNQRTSYAMKALEPIVQDSSSPNPSLAFALSQLWLGWAHTLASKDDQNIPLAIHLIRSSYQQLDALHRGDYMYWAQIGHALALSKLGQNAQMHDLINEIITCTSFARDELAKQWMRQLLEDSNSLWASNSKNVMHASYSKGSFLKECKLVAEGDAPVLFTGERGTGKESTGRLIHEMEGHAPDEFLCIDCEAISNSQYKDPLPLDQQSGLQPSTKTVFLNHVEKLPRQLQEDVLAYIQPRYSGSVDKIQSELTPRIFAATSDRLLDQVSDGAFNKELYNLLQINTLHVSPPALQVIGYSITGSTLCAFFLPSWRTICCNYRRSDHSHAAL